MAQAQGGKNVFCGLTLLRVMGAIAPHLAPLRAAYLARIFAYRGMLRAFRALTDSAAAAQTRTRSSRMKHRLYTTAPACA